MKYEHLWMMCAAATATVVVMGGAATAALAQQRSPIATVIGERPSDEVRTVRVSYRDLNLAAAHDEHVLNRRVGRAVDFVCTPDISYANGVDNGCAFFAWRGARPQIAMAVRRAREIAQVGSSSIPLVAIAISAH